MIENEVRGTIVTSGSDDSIGVARPAKFKGEYLLAQAALPKTNIENIGILLLDGDSDRLYCRFRRDFREYAGDDADWFEELAAFISERADALGARGCFEWMESTLSNTLLISKRADVLVDDFATTANELYAKHISACVLPFRTHLPIYSIEAAAGRFGKQMVVEPEGWVEVHTDIPLNDDMFVTHVAGHSMEPLIPDHSLCAFRYNIVGSWNGKVLLIERYGESGGSRYTVKRCVLSKNVDPNRLGDDAWLNQRITLESINPGYESWDVASAGKIRPLGEFLFVVGPDANN